MVLDELTQDLDASEWHLRRKQKRRTGCLLLLSVPLVLLALLVVVVTSRLMAKPTVLRDYVAEFNERYEGVPESETAWPLLQEATLFRLSLHGEKVNHATMPQYPDWPGWDECVEFIDSIQPALELVREASRRSMMGRRLSGEPDEAFERAKAEAAGKMYVPDPPPPFVPPGPPMVISVLLPELKIARDLARDVATDALIAGERGERYRVIENIETLLRLAPLCSESETLIGQLVHVAIESLALNTLSQIMSRHPELFDKEELARLDVGLRTIGRDEPATDNGLTRLVPRMELERVYFDDLLQRTYSDDGKGNGRLTLEGARFIASGLETTAPARSNTGTVIAMMAVAPPREKVASQYRELFETVESQFLLRHWDRDRTAVSAIESKLGLGTWRGPYSVIGLILPAYDRFIVAFDQLDAMRDAMIAVVAIERYRAEHGMYPSALQDLMPSLLPGLPFDPADGQPLRYRITEHGFVLYSIGRDGIDDGGRASDPVTSANPLLRVPSGQDTTGDWVLHPTPMPDPSTASMRLFSESHYDDATDEKAESLDDD